MKKLAEALKAKPPDLKQPFADLLQEAPPTTLQAAVIRLPEDRLPHLAITGKELALWRAGLTIADVQKELGGPARIAQRVVQNESGERRPVVLKTYEYANGAVIFAESDLDPQPGLVNRVFLNVRAVEDAIKKKKR